MKKLEVESVGWQHYVVIDGDNDSEQRQQEIARLIASAPELLEACKFILPIAEQVIEDNYDNLAMQNAIRRLQEAINKAEGV